MVIEIAAPELEPPLKECWLWPLRGGGWALMIGALLGLMIYDLMSRMPLVDIVIPILIGIPMAAAASTLLIEATRNSAGGRPGTPDWPDLSDMEQMFRQLILAFGAISMGTFPATGLRMVTKLAEAWQPPVYWTLLILGAAYVPACVLGVSLCGTLDGVDPRRAGPAMFRLGPGYLVAWALTALILVVAIHFPTYANRWLPYVGGPIVGSLLLYFALVVARLIGRLYGNGERFEF